MYANQNSEFCNYGVGFWVTTLLTEILLASLASIVVFWFSRRREYRADSGAAVLVGKKPMIEALETLRASINKRHLPEEMATFGISGTRKRGLAALFATLLISRIELGHCKSPHSLRLEFFSSSCWGRIFTVNLTFTLKLQKFAGQNL